MVGTRADKATKLCQSLGDEAAKLTNHLGNPILLHSKFRLEHFRFDTGLLYTERGNRCAVRASELASSRDVSSRLRFKRFSMVEELVASCDKRLVCSPTTW